jgi:site-specific recombinase XerD
MLDRDKYLSEQEARRLMKYSEAMALQALKRGTTFYVKAWAIIHTLLGTGTRASECRKIKIGDLRLGREPIVKVVGKGGKKRTVEISNDLKNHLKKYLKYKKILGEGADPDDYLFTNKRKRHWTLSGFQQLFKKMSKEAGLRAVYSIHSTRHTYGFMVYRKTKDIRLVQSLLGHSSISSTQIYAHVDPEAKRDAVNNLWV